MIIPVILAGGSGTRLWPLSRKLFPKQLIDLVSDKTMLQETVLRLSGVKGISAPVIICNEEHRFMVAEQMRSIGVKPAAIILEPEGRNTAPAVAVAALQTLKTEDDPTLLILPADHFIEKIAVFHNALEEGATYAEKNYLITFGIIPGSPETGYGYIKKGTPVSAREDGGQPGSAVRIEKFVEKPDSETAEAYVNSNNYCWNSGMFMFRAKHVLEEFDTFVPEITAACRTAVDKGCRDLDFIRLEPESFKKCPSDSIDYAVMEKTSDGVMIPFDAGWNDLGSWEALFQVGEKDENNNVFTGDILAHDVKNSFLHASSRAIAAVGLEDHIVVETSDAVLISPRDRVQDVKHLVNELKKSGRDEAITHKKVYRPWGSYESIDFSDRFQVKRITVKPGAKLSSQKHFHRAEHWVVVKGTAIVMRDDKELVLKEDESIYIPLGTKHRLENPGKIPLELIEVQSGSYLGEDDIVRYDDVYGR